MAGTEMQIGNFAFAACACHGPSGYDHGPPAGGLHAVEESISTRGIDVGVEMSREMMLVAAGGDHKIGRVSRARNVDVFELSVKLSLRTEHASDAAIDAEIGMIKRVATRHRCVLRVSV